jgi:hypothetical protein
MADAVESLVTKPDTIEFDFFLNILNSKPSKPSKLF